MSKMVEVAVAENSYDLMIKMAAFIAAVKTALADGWQMGSDLPVIVTAAIQDLVPAIQDGQKVGDEYAADKAAVIRAALLGAEEMIAIFVPEAKS